MGSWPFLNSSPSNSPRFWLPRGNYCSEVHCIIDQTRKVNVDTKLMYPERLDDMSSTKKKGGK